MEQTVATIVNLVSAGAVIIGVIIGVLALRTWRHELTAQRLLSFAEEALTSAFLVRDAICWARSPLNLSGDGASRPYKGEVETGDQKVRRDAMFAAAERLQRLSDLVKALRLQRHHAVALFGADVAAPFEELIAVWSAVTIDSGLLVQFDIGDGWADHSVETRRKLEKTIFARSGDDEIAARVDRAVEGIERLCRPMMEKLLRKERRAAIERLGQGNP